MISGNQLSKATLNPLDHELDRLAVAEKHIAEAEEMLSAYRRHVEQMRNKGEDLSASKNVLAKLDRTLIEWQTQRDIIKQRIESLKSD